MCLCGVLWYFGYLDIGVLRRCKRIATSRDYVPLRSLPVVFYPGVYFWKVLFLHAGEGLDDVCKALFYSIRFGISSGSRSSVG